MKNLLLSEFQRTAGYFRTLKEFPLPEGGWVGGDSPPPFDLEAQRKEQAAAREEEDRKALGG